MGMVSMMVNMSIISPYYAQFSQSLNAEYQSSLTDPVNEYTIIKQCPPVLGTGEGPTGCNCRRYYSHDAQAGSVLWGSVIVNLLTSPGKPRIYLKRVILHQLQCSNGAPFFMGTGPALQQAKVSTDCKPNLELTS
ncbi:hypothetical protein AVEN_6430-1 [Araneus ventricosus]|uniref:Uncharacterized protein n=1 Tax=Araneus ventricosus TaxID=182803 RepID=A0A4Y2WU97_ARAVE|nr:hypothetical protein AVEN_6430-1 [Araneus ventricosus]